MKIFIKNYWFYPVGGLVGAVAGYVYWLNWACDTGCPLTETPTRTVIYGAIIGGLLLSLFANKKKVQE